MSPASIDPTAAVPAEVAARIEVENNSRYKNLDKVARMKAEVTANAIATCANDNSCLQAEFDRADKMAAAYDVALTLSHYPQLSKEKADMLAQAVLDLAPGVSNASALYELLTGKTATGDEANRYFAAIGLVPVLGGIIKKGGQAVHVFAEADKAVDAAKVGVGGANGVGRGAQFADQVKLDDHFARHGSDFGAKNALEYQAQADKFLTASKPAGVLEKVRSNGDIVRYSAGHRRIWRRIK